MSTAAARPTILVVDDSPENRALLDAILKPDYRVKLASSGARAIAIAEADPPDLILLDVIMPDIDGFATCGMLKEKERTRDIPVIFLTGMKEQQEEEFGLALGAADYLSKPVNPVLVRRRVETQLRLRALSVELRQREQLIAEQRSAPPSSATLLELAQRIGAAVDAYEALRGESAFGSLTHAEAVANVEADVANVLTVNAASALRDPAELAGILLAIGNQLKKLSSHPTAAVATDVA